MTVASAQLLGGLHDEKPVDEEVRKVVTSVQGQFEREAKEKYKSLEPISYRKQIVAGANYFVRVSVKNYSKIIANNVGRPFLTLYLQF